MKLPSISSVRRISKAAAAPVKIYSNSVDVAGKALGIDTSVTNARILDRVLAGWENMGYTIKSLNYLVRLIIRLSNIIGDYLKEIVFK